MMIQLHPRCDKSLIYNICMDQLSVFLAAHPEFIKLESGKIRCTLTQHEFKPELKALTEHFSGKRYAQAKKNQDLQSNPIDFSKYPFIIPYVM
jgi:hypothetical protein